MELLVILTIVLSIVFCLCTVIGIVGCFMFLGSSFPGEDGEEVPRWVINSNLLCIGLICIAMIGSIIMMCIYGIEGNQTLFIVGALLCPGGWIIGTVCNCCLVGIGRDIISS